MPDFAHLHLHTQYSILDGAANIRALLEKVKNSGMTACAITDHGNMFGVMEFVKEAKSAKIKPIIGCEIYVARNSRFDTKAKSDRSGYHLILLAKNKEGYHNLIKLVSLANKEGFYYTPRVDKELLRKYSEGLIASTACVGGEIPDTILKSGKDAAREVVKQYLEIYGEDFYFELQRHGLDKQQIVNKILLELAEEFGIKIIATNDVHYINAEDYDAHNILICLNTGQDAEVDAEKGLHYTGQEYLKTPEEMEELFSDIPEAITNISEILEKIESFSIEREVILPVFPLPEGFENEDGYLKHITWEGARKRYAEISPEVEERINFELQSIQNMKFAGYFLIVQDFINAARRMGVLVGPGRGSAAGSIVAFCTGITDIDPIKYNLLFERFLNPERVSWPDIDIDFDDEGRDQVLKYVVEKYGKDRVAQIVTFGTMAAKSAIRDVARVLKLPLPDADKLAKLVPDGKNLKEAFSEVAELREKRDSGNLLEQKTLQYAKILEGSNRHTGTHACGVIIGRDNLIEHIPLSRPKDETQLMVVQYEGSLAESAGMLKMDFLGLKTLTIIKDCFRMLKKSRNISLRVEDIPLEDEKTIKLFQEAKTLGIFQFESDGMRNNLKMLRPNDLEDLIAMNALYRPGPMDFIPNYIGRKLAKEKIEYPHPLLENLLKPTYGIMVYQEQIMQSAQIIAGFSLAKADILRKAMGKKQVEVMQKMEKEFIEGAAEKEITKEKATEIFSVMSRFAQYGFNRSHSAAYGVLAFQTGYLKAHYPAEFMAAVLAHNMNDIKSINFYIGECKRMKIKVLGPDINQSELIFSVPAENVIRFGLGAIKGVGEAAVNAIIEERNENGPFKDIFDFVSRVNLRACNKKVIESMATTGVFDSFNQVTRSQLLTVDPKEGITYADKLIRYGNQIKDQKNSWQQSLFGDNVMMNLSRPLIPDCEEWSKIVMLAKEKEYIGFFVSGHPLDHYKTELENFCTCEISEISKYKGKQISIAGIIKDSSIRTGKNGSQFAFFSVEDFSESVEIFLFKENFLRYKHHVQDGNYVFITGKVESKFKNENEFTIDISEIKLLESVRTQLLKSVTFKIHLNDLDSVLTENIENLAKKFPGKTNLYIEIATDDSRLSLKMLSGTYKIDPKNEFFENLEEISKINLKIN